MPRLDQLAKVIRSKNAGPYQITLDVLFDDQENYQRVVASDVITLENVARLLRLDAGDIAVYFHPGALAVKITIPRKAPAGSIGDVDLYGAQQHVWLYDVVVP